MAVKDRAKPFDRKHRRTWLTVTGAMFVIMSLNVIGGLLVMHCSSQPPPPPDYRPIPPPPPPPPPRDATVDAGGDAGPAAGLEVAPDAGGDAAPSLPDHVER